MTTATLRRSTLTDADRAHIRDLVAKEPPLSAETRAKLAVLLAPIRLHVQPPKGSK